MIQTQKTSPSFLRKSMEHWLISFLCILATIHVLVFSAAFPFFNNVDEPYHFDLAVKYSRLDVPKGAEYISGESLQYMVVFSTWEYLYTNDSLSAPPWKQPMSQIQPVLLSREKRWRLTNYECPQPPLYYLLTGAWWRLCSALGFHDDFLLYLIRFLNVFFVVALVWLGWFAARLVFPENLFVRIAVPAFLALMPQTIFYSINNDVLSPLAFGIAFVCLVKFFQAEVPSLRLAMTTGMALTAVFLVKNSNLPLLAVSGVVVALKIWRLFKEGKLNVSLPPLVSLICCTILPAAAWMGWCKTYFGSFSGSGLTIQLVGWTLKPFSEWWHHPIFSPSGIWTYLSGQLGTFWQGEFLWHTQRLCLPGTDMLYTLLSLVLLAAVVPLLLLHSNVTPVQRFALKLSLACFVAALGFYAWLSIIYDFHNCANPSTAHPYFREGRLMLGALIPFLLLLAGGMDRMLDRFGKPAKWYALAILISTMLTLEIVTDWPVFSSQYNWFNM
jgi:hypothetical protein